MNLPHSLGLDRAIAFAVLARLTNIVGSAGTVLLIVRFLTPAEQGYYYTLLSLVSLQVVFEMGFSFVVQQLAAHECAHLELAADGTLCGDPRAHARLASALRLSLRWYSIAAAAMALVVAPVGLVFFGRHAGADPVAWRGPWLWASLASAASLGCVPLYAFIEGCGEVRAVAALRMRQAVASNALAWGAMFVHQGLYAPFVVIAAQIAVGLFFVSARRGLLLGLLALPRIGAALDWRREVWPFQWRIAISWMCSYFMVQILIPMVFAQRGAAEAGQLGMSLSITGYMTVLALVWISTKATPFGHMIARSQFRALDRLFLRTLGQSLSVFCAIAAAVCGAVALLPAVAPRLAARMVPAHVFLLLALAAGANCAVQGMGTLMRSFKREPLVWQSVAVAALTLLLAVPATAHAGNMGAALSSLVATAAIGLPLATAIFVRARRRYLLRDPLSAGRDDSTAPPVRATAILQGEGL